MTTVAELTVPGTLDSLKSIRDYVFQAAQDAGLDQKATYRLNLAVDEIATNIILHAYQEADLQGDITVKTERRGTRLFIFLEDSGAAYDPTRLGNPQDIEKQLDQRNEGGLGIFLTIRNVDQFNYQRLDGRNVHTFVMNLTGNTSA